MQQYIDDTLGFISENGYEINPAKFLKSTAAFLAKLFDVKCVLIDKYSPKKPKVAETEVVFLEGNFLPNIIYELANTPCENVINKKLSRYSSNVKSLFPKVEFLVQMNVDSYIGIPLWSSNKEPIGLIALMDDKPISEKKYIEIVLGIIAIKTEEVLEKMFFEDQSHLKIEELNIRKEIAEDKEEKFEKLSNLTFEGIIIHEMGIAIDFNTSFIKMFGYNHKDLVGKDITKIIYPKKYHKTIAKNRINNYTFPYEVEGIRKDGSVFPVEIEARNIFLNNNKTLRVTAFRDITGRKKTEAEYKKLSIAIEQSANTVVITDSYGNIEYTNPKFTEITGYAADEVWGKSLRILKTRVQTKEFYANIWQTISSGTSWEGQIKNKAKNGKLYWEQVIITPIKDDAGKITSYLAIKEDITHRKFAEQQLQKQTEKYKILSEDYLNQNSALKQLSNELSEKNKLLLESKDRYINLFEQNPVPLWEQDFSKVIKLLSENKAETKDLKTYLDENFDFVEECISNINILNVNMAALAMLGVKDKEELKSHLRKTNTKRAYEVLKKELATIGAGKKTFSDETEFIGKNGFPITALIKSVIIDDYGTSVASVIDITGERNITNELAEQKLLFEKMFNAIHDSIIITDTKREIVMANIGVKNILGYSPEELIGKKTEIFYSDHSKFEKAGDNVFNENSKNIQEDYITYYKTKENVIFPGETFGAKIFSNKGKWIGNIGVIRNISDRLNFINELQKAKEIAEKSENSLNEAQKIANIGSYELNFSTGFWSSSPTLNDIFGIDEKYIRNISGWLGIIYPEDLKMMEVYLEKNITENSEEFNKDYRIIRKTDKQIRWVHGMGKLDYDTKGNLKSLVGTIQDISEKRQILNDIIIAKEKAEESGRLKTEFIQNMSHEIRTPMNGILGFSELLDNPELSDEKRKKFIEIIKNSTNQLLHIIDDIMEISVLETKQIKAEINPVCLNDLLCQLFTIFNIKATKKNTILLLNKELTDQESTILTDKNKLNKVLGNLLENALKFTEKGVVELGYKLNKDREPAELEIYVKDSGIGIKPEQQRLIFERFSQAEKALSKKVGGLGLGLSIAKENAELLGGKISVVSNLGEGAVFLVSLPYKPVNLIPDITIEKVKTFDKNEKYTILIAEDEEVNFMVLEILLEVNLNIPCTIIHAKDGLEAVEICKNNPTIELVLMDIKMPKMDGHEATKRIKEFRPNLPIIAQTAYSTPEEKEKAFLAGCDDFLSKPISKNALNQVLNTCLLEKSNTLNKEHKSYFKAPTLN